MGRAKRNPTHPTGIAAPVDRIPFAPLLVATMRADFLGNALSYRPFADVLQNADLKLGPMNRTELADAIEQPAQKLGVTFAAGLVKRILTDVEGEPGILPLLEFALTELWRRRSGKQLTHAAYEEIGEVQGALGRHADREYERLSDADRERVRRIGSPVVMVISLARFKASVAGDPPSTATFFTVLRREPIY